MANYSFDIVSDYDKAELNNVVDQARREIANRYDLKDTKTDVVWVDDTKTSLKITGENDFHLEAVLDILRKKLAVREQSQKVLDVSAEPTTNNFVTTKIVPLKRGLDQEKAKKISALVRDNLPKVKVQIQGEELRVFSPKKDELQAVMDLLRQQSYDFPLQFTNYR
jgi:uncharacterized protein YajQ (UPF0234 family)